MATFEEQRGQLSEWRQQTETLRRQLLVAREGSKRGRQADQEEAVRLEREAAELKERGVGIWRNFEPFIDPKETLRKLEDRYPILLFPLRLETRFKGAELCVRVYPDPCLLESFEPSLTEAEIKNAQVFWSLIWRAGGVEVEEQAAWRELAASHGAGRAGWVIRNYLPLNPGQKPSRDTDADILLILRATGPVPAEAANFWEAVWRAGGDDAAIFSKRPALELLVGAAAAEEIIAKFRPVNLGDAPRTGFTRATSVAKVAAAQFIPVEDIAARRSSWSSAPRVHLLPERLTLLGYRGNTVVLEEHSRPIQTPLVAGPDPNAPPEEQLKPEADTLKIPDDLKWMFDFERAIEVGMAFRVNLAEELLKGGFTRLVVLGVRVGDSAVQGAKNLEKLLEGHLHSRRGLEILPQGTPTNNTEKGGSGYSVHGDPLSGFKAFFKDEALYTVESEGLKKRDGQRLVEALGIDHALGVKLPNAEMRDQARARAMHRALWPGTLGYMMRTMLKPVFSETDIEATRHFFANYVVGCGGVPALRIDAQPYGILPVTAFEKINWLEPRSGPFVFKDRDGFAFLRKLRSIVMEVEKAWDKLLGDVSFVGLHNKDPHQVLLDVLALQASSVEYYPLKAESESSNFFQLSFWNSPLSIAFLNTTTTKAEALALLRGFGYTGADEPELFKKLFSMRQPKLDGPVIDVPPVSETDPIQASAGTKNYIEWMLEAARTDIETLQAEKGFDAGKRPKALLYLMLRHALQLSFHLVGARQKVRDGLLSSVAVINSEPEFVHVKAASQTSESRYALLFDTLPAHNNIRVADYISKNLKLVDPELTEQVEALEELANAPTAQLERVFAEHIDCASYRLDAWKEGFLNWQLERLRPGGEGGVFLGAFGWLENVSSENKDLTPADVAGDVAAVINRPGDPTLMRDSKNLGLVHAPSLNHATTAAILRNGYESNQGRMAVDLSSRRVRLALGVLEGMRNGQSLAALLGYHFERQLHDSGTLSLRALVFGLRRKFPLVANQITTTQDDTAAVEAIAAMNVVDGSKLLAFVESSTVKTYPWSAADLPAPTEVGHGPAIDAAVAYIRDVNDAVADLVLAEGVHQAVSGNFDRSAGTLDAFSKGNYPPEPDVIRTPRTGTALVLRAAIHLNQDAAVPAGATPLARCEPAVNEWLKERMPAPGIAGCWVKLVDRVTNNEQDIFVSQQLLALQPVDVVYRLETSDEAGLQFLDDRVIEFVYANHTPRLDRPITITFVKREVGKVSLFELQALVRSLRALVVSSRPLQPADLLRTDDAKASDQPVSTVNVTRLTALRDDLLLTRVPALTAALAALPGATIDAAIDLSVAELSQLASFRLPQTGTGFAFEWRMGRYEVLSEKLRKLIERWIKRVDEANDLITDYDLNPGIAEDEKLRRLQTIEVLIGTSYEDPPPADAAAYRPIIGIKRDAYAGKLAALDAVLQTRHATLTARLAVIEAEAATLAPFDREGLDLTDDVKEVARFRQQLIDGIVALKADVEKRVTDANALLATVPLSVDKVQKAAKLLLGEDFQMIPAFLPGAMAATNVQDAFAHSTTNGLTQYLRNTVKREFPVDDWLHGVARIREKMAHWENTILLAEAFGAAAPEVTPIQLPHDVGAQWLAMEIPPPPPPPPGEGPKRLVESDRLLYNAHFSKPFDKTKPVCGLLVDEWTEVIPQAEETTGVAFHYDRPNSEPPQVWLLAMPAVMDGAWSWDELLGAVTGTLANARRRALEPVNIKTSVYSWLVPATYSAYTFPEISISNYLLRNVDVYKHARAKGE